MTKKRSLLVLCLLVLFSLLFVGCSNQASAEKDFTSINPPKEVSLGESVQLDEETEITVNQVKKVNGDDGEEVLIVSYDWTNLSSSGSTSDNQFLLTASQAGVKLEGDLRYVADRTKLVTSLPSGETMTDIEQGFILMNEEDIVISLKGNQDYIFIEGIPSYAYATTITIPYDSLTSQ